MIGAGGARYADFHKSLRAENRALRIVAVDLGILAKLSPGPKDDAFRAELLANFKRCIRTVQYLMN